MWAAWQHFIAAIFSGEYLKFDAYANYCMSHQPARSLVWGIAMINPHTFKDNQQTRCVQIKTNMLSLPMYSCWRESNYCTSHISYWSNPYITHLWSNTVIWSNTWLKHRSDNVTLILMCLLWTSSLHFVFVWIFKSICPNVFVLRGVLVLVRPVKSLPKTIYKDPFPRPLSSTHTHTHIYYYPMQKKMEKVSQVSTRNMLTKSFTNKYHWMENNVEAKV